VRREGAVGGDTEFWQCEEIGGGGDGCHAVGGGGGAVLGALLVLRFSW